MTESVQAGIALFAALLVAQSAVPGSYIGARIDLPKVAKAPAIDGTLANPAWQNTAAKVPLEWDLRDQQPANQQTMAYVMTDGRYLYVGFDAQQRQPIQAGQHTNDSSLTDNDYVAVYFWPNGSNGFSL